MDRKKVIVIGAYGHIGTFLVPMLVKAGYEVIGISRGKSQPYIDSPYFKKVTHVVMDRKGDCDFELKIARLQPDIVVDLINFDLEDTKKMVKVLRGTSLSHYLFCSSIWAHGFAETIPTDPNGLKYPLDEYGQDKYQSECYLKREYVQNGFPATIIMPGQISGPGWNIINPYGNMDLDVYRKIAGGETIYLPNFGMEVLHHVHGEDVAQMFYKAIVNRNQALGESFHAVAKESMTLYGYAKVLYEYFGQNPQIKFLSWDKWCEYIGNDEYIDHTYYHIARSGYHSIENAERLIGYKPKYSTRETVEIAMESYIKRGILNKEEQI